MERRIVFVGGEIAVDLPEVINLSFRSDDSLLDGDVIVFTIDLKSYHADDWFQGLRRLTDDCSFRLAKDVQHWRSELSSALTDGKTVIFFVTQIHQVSIATGRKEYSGTGRNARVTNIVTTLEPYNVIPIPVGTVVRKSGAHIKPTGDLGILATYWHEFGPYTTYDAYLDDFKGTTLLSTQTGGKTVGGILRHPTWKSALILLPTPDLSTAVDERAKSLQQKQRGRHVQSSSTRPRTETYRKKAEASVARQFISAVLALDKAARNATERTPPPAWLEEDRFSLQREKEVQAEIDENIAAIRSLQLKGKTLNQALSDAQELKTLLFERESYLR